MRVEGLGVDDAAPSVPVAHQAITLSAVTLHWRGDRSALMLDAAGQPDALLVADVHLGKAQRYQALGQSMPGRVVAGTTARTVQRLQQALASSAARRLVVLGDLVHGPRVGEAVQALADMLGPWHESTGGTVMVIGGNHDRHATPDWAPVAERLGAAWRVLPEDAVVMERGLALSHEARPVVGAVASLGGHLHPCWEGRGRARDRLRLPCFWMQGRVDGAQGRCLGVTLPAFGDFTGMHAVQPAPGDRLWLVTPEGGVHEVPTQAL
ncbi:MAG: metallophosphoesterase [Aquabacterium sp.]|jgi:metallophosphoesterase superfamily enzyme